MQAELNNSAAPRERELFLAALDKTDPGERAAFLTAACGSDSALIERVQALLREAAEAGDFLEAPALAGGPMSAGSVAEKPGDRIDRYKLLQKIGEGGCGVVYMAEQETPVRRRVALKVIKLGMDTKSVIARFEAERQALAMMDHPNIARVFDAGATGTGRPYFVMELVRGVRVTEYCDQNNLPTSERLRLFIQVCQAIQHAHQKGIIHRDVKPSNILVTLHDGTPVPKVIDFGIAKATEQRLTEKTLFTEFQAFIGTPAYTSPEQAEMSGLDIDTRSDIYSLGVLLYELLTGQTPFPANQLAQSGLQEMRRIIREDEPPRPSTRLSTLGVNDATTLVRTHQMRLPALVEAVRGDLDWIVMKCLEKDRTRRYDTANDLALDVQRYLENEPVLARPPTNWYRLQKLLRRHRRAFAAAAAMAAVLVAGATVSTWMAVKATRAEQRAVSSQRQETRLRLQAEQEKTLARMNEYVADINLAYQSLAAGNYGRALKLINKHRPSKGDPDLRGFEWRYLYQLCQGDNHVAFPTQPGAVQSTALSPDGQWLAVGSQEQLNVYDVRTQAKIAGLDGGALSLAFLPDGKTLVGAGPMSVRVWRTSDWTVQKSLPENSGPVVLSRDGRYLATQSRDRMRIWDTATWTQSASLTGASAPMAFSPDAQTLVTDSRNGITVWSATTGQTLRVLPNSTNLFARGPLFRNDRPPGDTPDGSRSPGPPPDSAKPPGRSSGFPPDLRPDHDRGPDERRGRPIPRNRPGEMARGPLFRGPVFRNEQTLLFSPDGQSIVAARNSLTDRGVFVIGLWDVNAGRELGVMPDDPERIEHTGMISCLAFSPDGRILATASMDHSIRLWDFAGRRRLATLQGHANEVWTLAFSPDGQTLVSGARDGGVKLWTTNREFKPNRLAGSWMPVSFSQDGRWLAALQPPGTLAFINLETRAPERLFPVDRPRFGFEPGVALSDDLKTMIQVAGDGRIQMVDTQSGNRSTLDASTGNLDLIALSPNGQILITGGRGQSLCWWDVLKGTNTVLATEGYRVLFSADGRSFVVFQRDNRLQIWDVESRSVRAILLIDTPPGSAVGFSADGRVLAMTAGLEDVDNTIFLWNTVTAKLIGTCVGHKQGVRSLAFSPDGKTLASAGDDSTLRLWNVATQQELLNLRHLGGNLAGLLFSPSGQMLVGASGFMSPGGGLRFYRAPSFLETDRIEPAINGLD